MFYLLDWGEGRIVLMSEDENELRQKRQQLRETGVYDEFELVIAQSVE